MLRLRFVAPLIAAMSVVSAAGDDHAGVAFIGPMLSQLGRGESAEIRVITNGCFGGSSYRFHVTGPAPLHVTVEGGADRNVSDLPRVGETALSARDALRADGVLAYYRAGPKSELCTSRTYVNVLWQRREGPSEEHWTDRSCGGGLDLSLSWIIERARLATLQSQLQK